MVNGSGNCGLAPGAQGQSGEFAFQKCTWASTIMRLLAGCGRACCAPVDSAAPATSVVPMNSRRVTMKSSPISPLFRGVSSLEDCNLGTAKTVCPNLLEEATHPRCGSEGYPDGPGRASKQGG